MTQVYWLNPDDLEFPPVSLALAEPNGLLAVGGDLSPHRILAAYRNGIFPWFNPGDPILWWSPQPRTVIYPDQLHISRSLRKTLRKNLYHVTFDHAFEEVMRHCAAPRSYADGTWISDAMIAAYTEIHQMGLAHSVEVWRQEPETEPELVGGLYGIALGQIFFGESMFSQADNASKVGFAHLMHHLRSWQFKLVDCQVANDHLFSLGATEIPREVFQKMLLNFTDQPATGPVDNNWKAVRTSWSTD
ncbi:MAG: leucyl/phenylalanyl-tRNA--protein transferase [Cellvibrio sp.]|jgi:leucyl/phenylalanyl-tRNA--protein transferase